MSAHRFMLTCLLWGLLGLTLAEASPLSAEPPPAATAAADESPAGEAAEDLRDPEALAELQRATDFLTALPRLQFKATIAYDVIQDDGRRLQFERRGELYLQRPDRLLAEVYLDDGRHRKFWYDGKILGLAELSKQIHTTVKAPPTIDGMLDMLETLFKDPMPLADLLYSDLSSLEERAIEADFVDENLVGSHLCSHLAFRGEVVDWQLWIDHGEQPFVRKLVISYREQPGEPQFTAWLDGWQMPDRFSDDLFTFVAPAGSTWIDVLINKPRSDENGGQP